MLNPHFESYHITTAATLTPQTVDCFIDMIMIVCANAGTTYTIKIQDKDTTPKLIVPQFTLTLLTTGAPNFLLTVPGESHLYAKGGFDIITTGTPGQVDVYLAYNTD